MDTSGIITQHCYEVSFLGTYLPLPYLSFKIAVGGSKISSEQSDSVNLKKIASAATLPARTEDPDKEEEFYSLGADKEEHFYSLGAEVPCPDPVDEAEEASPARDPVAEAVDLGEEQG